VGKAAAELREVEAIYLTHTHAENECDISEMHAGSNMKLNLMKRGEIETRV
jgi:hypothetical protein